MMSDPLSNFLVSRTGYCVQFASAFVMAARLKGIPARMAIGFLPGTSEDSSYTVRATDAHAWPELWFPDAGLDPLRADRPRVPVRRPSTASSPPRPARARDRSDVGLHQHPGPAPRRTSTALGAEATAELHETSWVGSAGPASNLVTPHDLRSWPSAPSSCSVDGLGAGARRRADARHDARTGSRSSGPR